MRIAIISDVHNNLTNLKKVLDFCAKERVEKIICCGDLASLETLDFLNDNFDGEIYFTFGNMDEDHLKNYNFDKKYKNTFVFKDLGEIFPLGGEASKSVAFVHFPNEAKKLAESGKYDFVFYGHTHKPWYSEALAKDTVSRKCIMLNPGNVAGEIYAPTFAMWNIEDGKFELIRIHELK